MTGKYGPQTAEVEALIERAGSMPRDEAERLDAAWAAAWDAAWAVSRDAAWAAAWDAAWAVSRDDVRAAVLALVVRDLIGQHGFTQAHYDLLTGPWAQVIGPVHPDDAIAAIDALREGAK